MSRLHLCPVRIQGKEYKYLQNPPLLFLIQTYYEHQRRHQASPSTKTHRTKAPSPQTPRPKTQTQNPNPPQNVLHHQIRRHLLLHRPVPRHHRRRHRSRQPRRKPRRPANRPSHQPPRLRRILPRLIRIEQRRRGLRRLQRPGLRVPGPTHLGRLQHPLVAKRHPHGPQRQRQRSRRHQVRH